MTNPNESKKKKSALIPIEKLHEFDGHPFKVQDNEEMQNLVESIKISRKQKEVDHRPRSRRNRKGNIQNDLRR